MQNSQGARQASDFGQMLPKISPLPCLALADPPPLGRWWGLANGCTEPTLRAGLWLGYQVTTSLVTRVASMVATFKNPNQSGPTKKSDLLPSKSGCLEIWVNIFFWRPNPQLVDLKMLKDELLAGTTIWIVGLHIYQIVPYHIIHVHVNFKTIRWRIFHGGSLELACCERSGPLLGTFPIVQTLLTIQINFQYSNKFPIIK